MWAFNSLEAHQAAEGLLHGVFSFAHLPADQQQSAAACQQYAALLCKFAQALQAAHAQQQQVRTQGWCWLHAAVACTDTALTHVLPLIRMQAPGAVAGNTGSCVLWPGLAAADLASLAAATSALASPDILWLPEFGCALLALRGGNEAAGMPPGASVAALPGQLVLHMVVPDAWQHAIHRCGGHAGRCRALLVLLAFSAHAASHSTKPCDNNALHLAAAAAAARSFPGGSHSTATPSSVATCAVGSVPAAQFPDAFVAMMAGIISPWKAAKKKGPAVKGFQRTPAFIKAVVADALRLLAAGASAADDLDVDALTKPAGGFTDVGLHTGGIARATSWELARCMLQVRTRHARCNSTCMLCSRSLHCTLCRAVQSQLALYAVLCTATDRARLP